MYTGCTMIANLHILFTRYTIASFIAGFCLMTLEIISARMLAPIIGTSLTVWSSVIGVTLLGLAAGSYWGGYYGDRHPDNQTLAWIFLAAATSLSLIPLALKWSIFGLINTMEIAPFWLISFTFAFIIFAPSSFFLGALEPVIVRISAHSIEHIGAEYGLLSASWSIGSIAGVLLAGYALIASLGTHATLFLIAFLVWGASIILVPNHHDKRRNAIAVGIMLWLIIAFILSRPATGTAVLASRETGYYLAQVVDTTFSSLGSGRALFLDSDVNTFVPKTPNPMLYYSAMIPFYDALVPDIKRILVVGGGGYSIPENIAKTHPRASITVLEIDPAVTKLAFDYFNLADYPLIQTIYMDPRLYLAIHKESYDLIVVDVFSSVISPPWQLATQEFFTQTRDHLAAHGAIVMNIVAPAIPNIYFSNLAATFGSVYPQSYALPFGKTPEEIQNIELAGTKDIHNEIPIKKSLRIGAGRTLGERLIPADLLMLNRRHILTDDRSSFERSIEPLVERYEPNHYYLYLLASQFSTLLKKKN